MPNVGIAIITHNARHHLHYCLPPLIQSPLKPKILLVNSSSSDGTVELAQQFGIETLVIPRNEFNHGSTRELARKVLNCEIIVMVTPDAYACDMHVLTHLVTPLLEHRASAAYAKQIPHEGAGFWESFPREFNYPEKSHIRSLKDFDQHGVYTYFFSDSFGAYLNSALDEIAGFKSVLTGEDTVAIAKLLKKGHKIAYVAEAKVKHSHRYNLNQEFKRHFDTGLARESYRHLIADDHQRGKIYVKKLFSALLMRKKFHWFPYAFIQTAVKWLGYQIGKRGRFLPLAFKRFLSAQDFYWNSVHNRD